MGRHPVVAAHVGTEYQVRRELFWKYQVLRKQFFFPTQLHFLLHINLLITLVGVSCLDYCGSCCAECRHACPCSLEHSAWFKWLPLERSSLSSWHHSFPEVVIICEFVFYLNINYSFVQCFPTIELKYDCIFSPSSDFSPMPNTPSLSDSGPSGL